MHAKNADLKKKMISTKRLLKFGVDKKNKKMMQKTKKCTKKMRPEPSAYNIKNKFSDASHRQ